MQVTKDLLVQNIPKKLKSGITDQFVDTVNDMIEDPLLREDFKENLISYTTVLADGQFTLEQYLDAVHYVTHRMMGSGIMQAYSKTFPERYQKLVDRGASNKDISSFSTAYNKNKLVNLIVEQSMIPTHILNVDTHQRAINKLAEIMANEDVSFRVQVDAATSLLTHLKSPEVSKVQVDVTVKDDSINELKQVTLELAQQQKKLLESGAMNTKEMAESSIIKTIPAEEVA